jgi:dTDP-glucose pyrophosphorylase
MRAIDRGLLGILLVVDTNERLLGTVTDGDIRRAILKGASLDDAIASIMNAAFTAVAPDVTVLGVLELMRTRCIRQVPVLDSIGRVVDLHYLPDLVDQAPRPNWAVIMAGGEGRRLRPWTQTTPKPMLPVGDRPLLENLIELLVNHRFHRLFVSINYLGDQIVDHFGDGSRFGCDITYLQESKALGTAGALGLLPERPRDPLLVLNGDLLTDVNLSALMDYHADAGCSGTQCVLEYEVNIPFGVVKCQDGQVVEVEEKPRQTQLINAGIYVLSPSLLDLVPADQYLGMPELLSIARAGAHRVAAFPIRERWTDIGRPDDYIRVRQDWLAVGS